MSVLLVLLAVPAASGASGPEFERGKIAAGSSRAIVVVGGRFGIVRLGFGGNRDTSFGTGGLAVARYPGFAEDRSVDGFLRADGRVVVGGYVTQRCRPRRGRLCGVHAALARFTARGALDRSFGSGGRIVLSGSPGTVRSVAELPGGGVAIGGRTRGGLPFVAHLRADGTRDRSFANNGELVLHSVSGRGAIGQGRVDRIVPVPGGGELASFSASGRNLRLEGLMRLTGRGRVDDGFGDLGFLTALPAGARFDEYGFGFAPLPDGDILVAAITGALPQRMAVVRLQADGSPDTSYGAGGVALGPSSYEVRFDVDLVAMPDGGAVLGVAGFISSAVARLAPDGTVETAFGEQGLSTPSETWGYQASIAVLSDGSIVLADTSRQLSGLVVSRYADDGTPLFSTELGD